MSQPYWQQPPQPPQVQPPGGLPPQQPPQTPQPPGGLTPPQTPAPGGEAVAPPAPKVTPLDPPAVFYNKNWRVAPLLVDTKEAADALDPNEWTSGVAAPGAAAGQADKPQWPQLWFNVNVSPKIVNDAKEARSLGDEWQQFQLPDALCKAAEAANAAKAQKQQQQQQQAAQKPQ